MKKIILLFVVSCIVIVLFLQLNKNDKKEKTGFSKISPLSSSQGAEKTLSNEIEEESLVFPETSPPPPPPPPPSLLPPLPPSFIEMPRFPGCDTGTKVELKKCAEKKMLNFIYSNLNYPKKALKDRVEGLVIVSFIVREDGKIVLPKIAKSLSKECDAEAIRIIELMPRWKPGQDNINPREVKYNLPIKFKLR